LKYEIYLNYTHQSSVNSSC